MLLLDTHMQHGTSQSYSHYTVQKQLVVAYQMIVLPWKVTQRFADFLIPIMAGPEGLEPSAVGKSAIPLTPENTSSGVDKQFLA